MAKATAIFEGDDSRLQAAIKRIDKSLLAVQARFSKFAGAITPGLTAAGAAGAVMGAGIKNALDVAGDFLDLQNQTGIAVEDLAVLSQEAKNSGKSIEDVAGAVNKMQKALADGSADDSIRGLGVDLAALKGQTPVAQFQTLGKAIDGIGNPAERAAVAMKIFGKSGAGLLAMFASKGFGDAAKQVGEQAKLLQQDAVLFDAAGEKIGSAGVKTRGFFVGVADRIVPAIMPLLDRFEALDLAAAGQSVGDTIAAAAQSMQSEDFGEIIYDSLALGFGRAVNFLAGALLGIIPYLGGALIGLMGKVAHYFNNLLLDGLASLPLGRTVGRQIDLAKQRNDAQARLAEGVSQKVLDFSGKAFKAGALIDTEKLADNLANSVGRSFDQAQATGAGVRGDYLNKKRRSDGSSGSPFIEAGAGAVSALQAVGGAFGAGGSGGRDPLLSPIEEIKGLMQQLVINTTGGGDRWGAGAYG